MPELPARLARYAAIATAIPVPSVLGAIQWSGPGDVGSATPGNPLLVDFGPGIGEVFKFEANFLANASVTFSAYGSYPGGTYTQTSSNGLIKFNPSNSGGVPVPGVMAGGYNPFGFTDDPRLLGSGAPVSAGQSFVSMTSVAKGIHVIGRTSTFAIRYSTGGTLSTSINYGDWRGGNRGFIGFTMQLGGAAHFGWLDVEYLPGAPRSLGPELIVHGWAFNDAPRGPITAGDVPAPAAGGLAALALGAAGIRRKRRAVA